MSSAHALDANRPRSLYAEPAFESSLSFDRPRAAAPAAGRGSSLVSTTVLLAD